MILREVAEGKSKPFSFSGMQKIVQRMRKKIGLPQEFTLDACRHGLLVYPKTLLRPAYTDPIAVAAIPATGPTVCIRS